MNETISLLLATAFLAIGGLGLYIYKTSDDDNKKGGSKYKDNDFFQTESQDDYFEEDEDNDNEEVYESKVRARNTSTSTKTKRNKRNTGTKRRY
jgi:hypothetical protein